MDNFLGTLWDDAKGVFSAVIDFEKFKFERELANDRLIFERQLAARQAPVNPATGLPSVNNGTAQTNFTPFVIAGAVVLGVVLLIKS